MQADFTEVDVADMIGDASLPFDVHSLGVSSEPIGIECRTGDCDESVKNKPGLGNFLDEVMNRIEQEESKGGN